MNKIQKLYIFFFAFCGILNNVSAQEIYFEWQQTIPVTQYGKTLQLPWAGGLNAAQFSSIDLNHDQQADLVVFERTAGKIFTFLRKDNFYEYAPEYEAFFPQDLKGWVLLKDYDQDGRPDIFTHTPFGIKVYQNITPPQFPPQWKLVIDPIRTQGFRGVVNLQVNILDIPIIADIDQDGDLDVLCFDFGQGSWLELHKNLSQEKKGNAQSLEHFERITTCWGGLIEGDACGQYTFGYDCDIAPKPNKEGGYALPTRITHIGSTLAVQDLNGDGLLDVLIGEISCPQLYHFTNVGTPQKARFEEVGTAFPPDKPIEIANLPAVFFEDINQDGKLDLLASPNAFINQENEIDFQHSVWYYQNEGTAQKPDFRFKQKDFLQNEMIEVGENAFPVLIDLDSDGDLDLIIGERGKKQGNQFFAKLYYYENIGTKTKAHFKLIDEDYLGLSDWQITDTKPFVYDINADQLPDLGLVYTQGRQTALVFFINQASKGKKFIFDKEKTTQLYIDLDYGDFPTFLPSSTSQGVDILMGKRRGGLTWFESRPPTYFPHTDTLGGIKAGNFRFNLTPLLVDFNQNGILDVLTGDAEGFLRWYPDATQQLEQNWKAHKINFYNPLDFQTYQEDLGASIFPTVGDLNGDGLSDLLIGTSTGGIRIAFGKKKG